MDRGYLARARRGARSRLLVAAPLALAAAALAPATAHAELAAGLVGRDTLVLFDTARPGFVAPRAITGLEPADTVVGIDVRPATGQLYALAVPDGSAAGATVRTYTVDPQTGAATSVGQLAGPGATGDHRSGVDFNPRADRVRVVQSTGVSFRVNPNNSSLAAADTPLAYTAPAVGPLVGIAYDRNVPSGLPGTLPTTAYGIDAGASRLVSVGSIDGNPLSANGGQVLDVGALGVTLDPRADAGFDISPTGAAYAALRTEAGVSGLYALDLATGAATLAGALPADLRSLAILPPGSATLPPEPPPVVVRETVTVPGPTVTVPGPVVVAHAPPPGPRRPVLLIEATAPRYAALLGGRATVRFSCDTACSAAVTLVARRTAIATGNARLAEAGVGTVRLTATAAGRRLLAPGRARRGRRAARAPRSVSARLTLTASGGPRLGSTASARLVLRR